MNAAQLIPSIPLEEFERRERRANSAIPELWDLLDAVKDPEIPVVARAQLVANPDQMRRNFAEVRR